MLFRFFRNLLKLLGYKRKKYPYFFVKSLKDGDEWYVKESKKGMTYGPFADVDLAVEYLLPLGQHNYPKGDKPIVTQKSTEPEYVRNFSDERIDGDWYHEKLFEALCRKHKHIIHDVYLGNRGKNQIDIDFERMHRLSKSLEPLNRKTSIIPHPPIPPQKRKIRY